VGDLLVIGGGSAGLVGARTAASFGASVLLVERDRPGGDCLWTGCVPSKALLATAGAATDARTATRFGIESRKLVARAKGALMESQSLTEPQAFRWIQRAAMGRRTTTRVVARRPSTAWTLARGLTRPLGQCSTVEG